ncbi:septum site-determining protein MinC [Rosenbergiella australiborealis]|uniref:Probable septum site-determining protein MinC n=1 Tax=Rosenbergiella australiborealis TaxID=1544696 RepID=A0ABS5T1S9_9GAMM|nr:septum site-determining protein MinC [Rosenbergiella australiborealis]MBT0726304.1 septum site-determining protein MinC [Rosenbergiella australiborealis]
MSQTPIELKGSNFTLSVVHINHSQPDVVLKAIQEKIAQAPAFLANAPVVVNVSSLNNAVDWKKMHHAVSQSGLKIVGISGCKDEQLKAQITSLGIPLLNEGKTSAPKAAEVPAPVPEAATLQEEEKIFRTRIIDTPIRSGQQIYARNADLIVTSSVSAGAELVADGNIHIYGNMRGRALAGASGDQQAQIFCTHLAAELVSIAGEYWIMDQIPSEYFSKAARLALREGSLAIESLN